MSRYWDIIQCSQEMNYLTIKGIQKLRLHTVWFQLHDILKKAYENSEKISGCHGLGKRMGWIIGGFSVQWKYYVLYYIIVDIHHYIFLHTHRMYNTKSQP